MELPEYFASTDSHRAVSLTDLEGRILLCNERMDTLLGLRGADTNGGLFADHFKPRDRSEESIRDWFSRSAAGEPVEVQCVGQRGDGSTFPARLVLHHLRDGSGQASGFMVMAENMAWQMAMEMSLRLSSERFAKAFTKNPDAMVIFRKSDGTILEVTEGWNNIFGSARKESVGKTSLIFDVFWSTEDLRGAMKIISAQGRVRDRELCYRNKGGRSIYVLYSSEFIEINGEDCLLTVVRDITDLRKAVMSLERSEGENRALLTAIPDAIFQFGSDRICLAFKPGQEAGDFAWWATCIGKHVGEIFPREYFPDFSAIFERSRRHSHPQVYGFQLMANGRARDLEARIVSFGVEQTIMLLREVTGSLNLERTLAGSAMAEQYRLVGELHDGISQELTGISILCKSLHGSLRDDQRELAARVEEISGLVNQSIGNLRVLIAGVYPPGLRMGLARGLQEMALRLGRIYPIAFSFSGDDPTLEQEEAAHLYRIAQEAANNAAKHGSPKAVRISLEQQSDLLILRVSDDGCGFDPDEEKPESQGLDIMQYRARLVGGWVGVDSDAGAGCTVTCRIPLGKPASFPAARTPQ
ncbi:MAG: sensor protein fixL [Fibrobacteres bacterium]|nr:sensor protein fixL [Fibrobacterota bacterium]